MNFRYRQAAGSGLNEKFLYQRIASDLIHRISLNHYRNGDTLEKNEVLVKRYNTSIITVNKALRILAEKGYIKRIPGKGSIVLDTSPAYNNHKTSKSKLIGAVVFDIARPYIWPEATKAIEDFLYPIGYHLLVGNDDGDYQRTLDYIDQFAVQEVEGIVFVPLSYPSEELFYKKNTEIINRLVDKRIPFVTMHRRLRDAPCIQIGFDNYYDSVSLTHALARSGYTNPMMVSDYFYDPVNQEREQGFTDTLGTLGISNSDKSVFRLQDDDTSLETDSVSIKLIGKVVAERKDIDSIIAVNSWHLDTLTRFKTEIEFLAQRRIMITGFCEIANIPQTNDIDLLMLSNPKKIGELSIKNLVEVINLGRNNENHIIRIPSVLHQNNI